MIDIKNKNYQPDLAELREFVNNPLFDEICRYMESEYNALQKIEYSGDNILLGWNIKFKKAGRTLCTVYPRPGHFFLLLIVGRKEKDRVEAILPTLSTEFCQIYQKTPEGMGQRWLLLDFDSPADTYRDVLKIVRIRRESKYK